MRFPLVLVSSAVVVLGLTGCASLQPSFCEEYESAWQHFVEVRDGEYATPMAVIEASHELRARWAILHARDDVPADVRDMVVHAESSFVSAWIASSPSDRNAYQRSWTNGRDYIALSCSEIGVDLHFDGDSTPIESPRLTDQ